MKPVSGNAAGMSRPTVVTLGPTGTCHERATVEYMRFQGVEEEIGEIDTTWVVYGTRKRFAGELIGIPSPELFRAPTPA